MRRALTITKHLTLNTLSILRAGKARIMFGLMGAVILGLYFFVVFLTFHSPSVWLNARKAVDLPGLTKEDVVVAFAVFQTLSFVAIALLPRRDITVSEQAEYKVSLATPITMQEYLLGRLLHLALHSVLVQSFLLVPGAFYVTAFSTTEPLQSS